MLHGINVGSVLDEYYSLNRSRCTAPQVLFRSTNNSLSLFSKVDILSLTHKIGLNHLYVPQLKHVQALSLRKLGNVCIV